MHLRPVLAGLALLPLAAISVAQPEKTGKAPPPPLPQDFRAACDLAFVANGHERQQLDV